MMDTCRSTFAQTHRTYGPTGEPHVNCGRVSGDAPAVPDAASGPPVRTLMAGEAVHESGQGPYRKSLHLPLDFAANLKLL